MNILHLDIKGCIQVTKNHYSSRCNKLKFVVHNLPFVHNLEVSPFQETAHLRLPGQYGLDQISGDLLPLLVRQRNVPLLKPQLSLPAEQQHELHLTGWGKVQWITMGETNTNHNG